MSTTPLKIEEGNIRPRDWQPRRSNYKVPLRLMRLCLLGVFLPFMFIAGPIYLRYRVYSEQLYPLTISDQRLIDAKISTTWCQRQIVKANTTFNAYLMNDEPTVENEEVPVAMTRQLILEDDMKEYWGFYLLRGSSVTVSTCVRWPGASLTIIRGHKHLHECAFIGDDSSEELEELLEVVQEQGFFNTSDKTGVTESLSNIPEKMKRAGQDVQFHHKGGTFHLNISKLSEYSRQSSSHELDAKTMRNILTQLFAKTSDTKKKQKENPHHHYEGVFKESANIDKPSITTRRYPDNLEDEPPPQKISATRSNSDEQNTKSTLLSSIFPSKKQYLHRSLDIQKAIHSSNAEMETSTARIIMEKQAVLETKQESSAEVFQDILRKINSMGHRGKQMLRKLIEEINARGNTGDVLKQMVNETMNNETLSMKMKLREKRDLLLPSLLDAELMMEDEDGDAPLEEGMLHPDGIAEHRGTVNETMLNDRSNSEFWSSFSSSEERLLECKGLILNLPLTPHRYCIPKNENQHSIASFANTVTYRVPVNGYYFFVFNSENEIQPNYVRVKFNLLKTVYNISNPAHTCKNSTNECSLPLTIFSKEKTVLELPLSGNDSQWNEEYVIVSTCEPRTTIYVICIIMVPLLILCFAFY